MTDYNRSGSLKVDLTEEQKKLLLEAFGEEFVAKVSGFEVTLDQANLTATVVKN